MVQLSTKFCVLQCIYCVDPRSDNASLKNAGHGTIKIWDKLSFNYIEYPWWDELFLTYIIVLTNFSTVKHLHRTITISNCHHENFPTLNNRNTFVVDLRKAIAEPCNSKLTVKRWSTRFYLSITAGCIPYVFLCYSNWLVFQQLWSTALM